MAVAVAGKTSHIQSDCPTLERDLSPLALPTKESLAQPIKPGIEFPLISHRDTEGAEIHGVFLLRVTSVSPWEKNNV